MSIAKPPYYCHTKNILFARISYLLLLIMSLLLLSQRPGMTEAHRVWNIKRGERSVCWDKFKGVCVPRSARRCPFPFSQGTFTFEGCSHRPQRSVCCYRHLKPSTKHKTDLNESCGFSKVESNEERWNKILGGQIAEEGAWPWLVSIRRRGIHICGGSLLSNRWVLTAAHCFKNPAFPLPSDFDVVVGQYKLSRTSGHEQFLAIRQIYKHPNYSKPQQSHDIALIKIKSCKGAQMNRWVSPICLPNPGEKFENKICAIAGWGDKGYYGPRSDILLELNLPIYTSERCHTAFNKNQYLGPLIYKHNFCAGFETGTRDSCPGDSGGPIVCPLKVGSRLQWVQAGLVSWGKSCGDAGYPGVYTRTEAFLPWITTTMTK